MKIDESDKTFPKIIESAIENQEIPKLYVNDLAIALGHGDIFIVLQHNSNPVATLNLSYTMAKTFSVKLGQVIKELENLTDNTIMTTDDIDIALRDAEKGDNNDIDN